ncbi:MAG: phenylalanine--tRNA ligase subunit beta [Desulfobacterales bacterium]|jgi:phenylalanyl-tRNA synthetase beta chain|nr:phenylalanine--tRNA ligase subunit beta [Desulfobacteraceae bacterium]MDD3990729.1 phenylalanine--tRNA ligase subunit beta [Desulfobacteraceae bacterium]MDY0310994.1 phenylalanine--tRNA ligase subunit beta [Desulfobacterales bacterium]
MKVSWSWLTQYVEVDLPPARVAEALTMVGLEVAAVTDRYGFLETVRVGRIIEVFPHPRADRLKCCRVDIGEGVRTIVCGAPNAAAGRLAPCALPGTEMPGGRVLRAEAMRGVTSEGMLCSASELGLGADADGLMLLDDHLTVGAPLNRALNLSDPVLEIELTPNRPDCLSILGIAREVAAICGKPLTFPSLPSLPEGDEIHHETSVQILAPDHCPRYAARLLSEVAIGPSPDWLQDRLRSVDLKPINNVVDVTNFVMMELGQPLHAFDFDRLRGGRIVVRTAAEGTPFVTLDQKERHLTADTLMICDAEGPVAIGGVMGGLDSEIQASTTRVLLESACFDPVSIRKTAKRFHLSTDAAYRFERGVDPHGTIVALNRAAALIREVAGGRPVSGHIDVHPRPAPRTVIQLDVHRANQRLGTDLDGGRMKTLLEQIGFGVSNKRLDHLEVRVPSFRVDVSRSEDLTEEIARRHGYEKIATTHPVLPATGRRPAGDWAMRQRLRERMAGLGFAEVITYSFVHRDSGDRLRLADDDPRRREVVIRNPLSEDQAVMRTSLVPGLLETASRNIAMGNRHLKLFEVGKVFVAAKDSDDRLPEETQMLAALWTGQRQDEHWAQDREKRQAPCDFFDLKGVLEALLEQLGIAGARFGAMAPEHCDCTRPGLSAWVAVEDRRIGFIGEVHPDTRVALDLKQPALVFELNLPLLTGEIPAGRQSQPIPRFPAIARDMTLIVEATVESARLAEAITATDEPLVESVTLFDQYIGDPIPQGRKSVSFRITYRSDQGTLVDEQINPLHQKITERLLARFGAALPT